MYQDDLDKTQEGAGDSSWNQSTANQRSWEILIPDKNGLDFSYDPTHDF